MNNLILCIAICIIGNYEFVKGSLNDGVTEFYDTNGGPVHMIVSGSVLVSDEPPSRLARNAIPSATKKHKHKAYHKSISKITEKTKLVKHASFNKKNITTNKVKVPKSLFNQTKKVTKVNVHKSLSKQNTNNTLIKHKSKFTFTKRHHKIHNQEAENERGRVRDEIPSKSAQKKTIYPPPSNMWAINKELSDTEQTLQEKGELGKHEENDEETVSHTDDIVLHAEEEKETTKLSGRADAIPRPGVQEDLSQVLLAKGNVPKYFPKKAYSENHKKVDDNTVFQHDDLNARESRHESDLKNSIFKEDHNNDGSSEEASAVHTANKAAEEIHSILKSFGPKEETSVKEGGKLLHGKEPFPSIRHHVKPLVVQTSFNKADNDENKEDDSNAVADGSKNKPNEERALKKVEKEQTATDLNESVDKEIKEMFAAQNNNLKKKNKKDVPKIIYPGPSFPELKRRKQQELEKKHEQQQEKEVEREQELEHQKQDEQEKEEESIKQDQEVEVTTKKLHNKGHTEDEKSHEKHNDEKESVSENLHHSSKPEANVDSSSEKPVSAVKNDDNQITISAETQDNNNDSGHSEENGNPDAERQSMEAHKSDLESEKIESPSKSSEQLKYDQTSAKNSDSKEMLSFEQSTLELTKNDKQEHLKSDSNLAESIGSEKVELKNINPVANETPQLTSIKSDFEHRNENKKLTETPASVGLTLLRSDGKPASEQEILNHAKAIQFIREQHKVAQKQIEKQTKAMTEQVDKHLQTYSTSGTEEAPREETTVENSNLHEEASKELISSTPHMNQMKNAKQSTGCKRGEFQCNNFVVQDSYERIDPSQMDNPAFNGLTDASETNMPSSHTVSQAMNSPIASHGINSPAASHAISPPPSGLNLESAAPITAQQDAPLQIPKMQEQSMSKQDITTSATSGGFSQKDMEMFNNKIMQTTHGDNQPMISNPVPFSSNTQAPIKTSPLPAKIAPTIANNAQAPPKPFDTAIPLAGTGKQIEENNVNIQSFQPSSLTNQQHNPAPAASPVSSPSTASSPPPVSSAPPPAASAPPSAAPAPAPAAPALPPAASALPLASPSAQSASQNNPPLQAPAQTSSPSAQVQATQNNQVLPPVQNSASSAPSAATAAAGISAGQFSAGENGGVRIAQNANGKPDPLKDITINTEGNNGHGNKLGDNQIVLHTWSIEDPTTAHTKIISQDQPSAGLQKPNMPDKTVEMNGFENVATQPTTVAGSAISNENKASFLKQTKEEQFQDRNNQELASSVSPKPEFETNNGIFAPKGSIESSNNNNNNADNSQTQHNFDPTNLSSSDPVFSALGSNNNNNLNTNIPLSNNAAVDQPTATDPSNIQGTQDAFVSTSNPTDLASSNAKFDNAALAMSSNTNTNSHSQGDITNSNKADYNTIGPKEVQGNSDATVITLPDLQIPQNGEESAEISSDRSSQSTPQQINGIPIGTAREETSAAPLKNTGIGQTSSFTNNIQNLPNQGEIQATNNLPEVFDSGINSKGSVKNILESQSFNSKIENANFAQQTFDGELRNSATRIAGPSSAKIQPQKDITNSFNQWPSGVNPGAQYSSQMIDLWKAKGIAPERGYLRGSIQNKQRQQLLKKQAGKSVYSYGKTKSPQTVMSVLKPKHPTGPSIAYEQTYIPDARNVYSNSKSTSKSKGNAVSSASNTNTAKDSNLKATTSTDANTRHQQNKNKAGHSGYGQGSGSGYGYGEKAWGWGGGGGWAGSPPPGGKMPSPADFSAPPSNIPKFPTGGGSSATPASKPNGASQKPQAPSAAAASAPATASVPSAASSANAPAAQAESTPPATTAASAPPSATTAAAPSSATQATYAQKKPVQPLNPKLNIKIKDKYKGKPGKNDKTTTETTSFKVVKNKENIKFQKLKQSKYQQPNKTIQTKVLNILSINKGKGKR